jgi:hypothetical protein
MAQARDVKATTRATWALGDYHRFAWQKGIDKPAALKGKVRYGGRLNLRKALNYLGN